MLINRLLERLGLVRRSVHCLRVGLLEGDNAFLKDQLDQREQDLLVAHRRVRAIESILSLKDEMILNPPSEIPLETDI